MNCVVGSSDFFTRNHRLQADKFQSFLLKSSNNFTNKSSLNSIGLYHNIRSFHNLHHTQPKITPLSGMRSKAQRTYWMPPLTKWRVHLTLREFLPSFTMFFRAFEFLNHMILPSRLTNIIPVPGSISSPEKLQILLSGIMLTLRLTFSLRDLCHAASRCHQLLLGQGRF